MIKYRKILLIQMKSILSYFDEFFNNKFILSKVYSNNCMVKRLDQKPIIMLIYDKNIFFCK